MNDLAPLAPVGPVDADDEAAVLAGLRAEIDDVDDALHDLLMRRAEIVQRVAACKHDGRGRLRPGREAAIIRRLLARHRGSLPPSALVRIWRELLTGSVAMQAPFSVAVCETEPNRGQVQAAREQFGALTALTVYASPLHAIGAVSAGTAAVAILPLPREDEAARSAWWPALLRASYQHGRDARMHVIARLPFWSRRADGAPAAESLAIAAMPPDPSGDDRSLVGVELPPQMSRARLAAELVQAGFDPGALILLRDEDAARVLCDVAGFVADDDPRLARLQSATHAPVVLGAYACPVPAAG